MNKYVLTINGWDRYDVFGFESAGALVDVQEELARVLKEEWCFINWYGRRHYIDDAEIKIYTWDDYWIHISSVNSAIAMINP
jgi:hypothetical protein